MIPISVNSRKQIPAVELGKYSAIVALPCQAEYTEPQQEIILGFAQDCFHQNGATFVVDPEKFSDEFWDSIVEAFGGIWYV